MAEQVARFAAEPAQWAFMQSEARVRGYGGAVGGGKSRTLMEAALDYCLRWPGIQVLVVRQRHTSIIETTRKTFFSQVLAPVPALEAGRKQSQGEDWVDIWSSEPGVRSRINFIGLDDVDKWMSSEVGVLIFDEAHEFDEWSVVQLAMRTRQTFVCPACRGERSALCERCSGAGRVPGPSKVLIGFNPSNPGHWLEEWFVLGGSQTEFGFYKRELVVKDAAKPIGDCEFFFANAYANPHLPKDYIEQSLESLPEIMRRRYLLGEWVLVGGSTFFDAEALTFYDKLASTPRIVGESCGDVSGGSSADPIRFRARRDGPWSVWKPPVRGDRPHRYVVSVDVSSGGSSDWTAIQVVDIEAFEQVAEFQAKLDPDLVAVEAFRAAVVYNGALVAAEVTGGWGHTINRAIEKLLPKYRGPVSSKPRLYTRRVIDRIAKKWTDKLGWDTNSQTRALMLDSLEEVLRERLLVVNGPRTVSELKTFIRDEKGRPAAMPGKHDDLAIALAIGVFVAQERPRVLRRARQEPHRALSSVTGY